jgi:hypothetical protein
MPNNAEHARLSTANLLSLAQIQTSHGPLFAEARVVPIMTCIQFIRIYVIF